MTATTESKMTMLEKSRATGKTPWIAFTGLDGSGKTTMVEKFVDYLEKLGYKVKRDRLPHDRYLVTDLLDKSTSKYTDRMLFALDNRLFDEELREWKRDPEIDVVVTQRCYLDSFVHGAVQGFGYGFIAELNRVNELQKCDVMVHMVAEVRTAYARIEGDPDADKFEYPEYMAKQERETRHAYKQVMEKNLELEHFHNHECVNIYVDTTDMDVDEVFEYIMRKLREKGVVN